MRAINNLLGGPLFLVAGALAGVASAVAAIELYGATPAEPGSMWETWEVSKGGYAQPYALDHYLMAGRFPPAAGQMREYSAARAADGSSLTGRCDYTLTAKPAPAQWWSMAGFASGTAAGSANALITSDMAVAESDGTVRIAVSRNPASGNWIRPPAGGNFGLIYTLSDSRRRPGTWRTAAVHRRKEPVLTMNRLFWLIAALLTAVAAHAAFVLEVPSSMLQRSITRISSEAGPNAFFVLAADDQSRLFPAYPPSSVTGACAFDVSKTNVDLTADMPAGFWTLTVYSSSGEVIYALNDTQSGTGTFTLSLIRAPGLLEMLSRQSADDPPNTAGWTVSAADPRGLAVLWQPVAEPALRASVVRAFQKSVCKAARPAG